MASGKTGHLLTFRLRKALRSPWFWLIAAAYVLRIALMPLTGQHDVMFMPWQAHYVALGHWNPYAFLNERFGDVVRRPPVWAPYPYSFYALTAGWFALLDRLHLVNLAAWDKIWIVAQPARSVFLAKLAYLPFDLGIGWLLSRAVRGRRGMLAWALWAWSPVALYTPFLMGQNDIYATAFMVAGLSATVRSLRSRSGRPALDGWALLAVGLLGLGSTFKIYPLLLVPPVALMLSGRWRERLLYAGLGMLPFVLVALPFLATPAFRDGVLFNPEGVQILRETTMLGVSGSPYLVWYIGLLIVLSTRRQPPTPDAAWRWALLTFAPLFLLAPTAHYWLLWLAPLCVVVASQDARAAVAWFGLQLSFALSLPALHRELGVALPIHLSSEFSLPNANTAIAALHPQLQPLLARLATALNAQRLASLGVITGVALFGRHDGEEAPVGPLRWQALAGLVPTLVLLGALGANLYVARSLVGSEPRSTWDGVLTLSAESPVASQALTAPAVPLTGVDLVVDAATPVGTALEFSIYPAGAPNQAPLARMVGSVVDEVGVRRVYAPLAGALRLTAGTAYRLEIRLPAGGSPVTLRYASALPAAELRHGDQALAGALNLIPLRAWSLPAAWRDLVGRNLGGDPWLLLLMALSALGSALWIALAPAMGEPVAKPSPATPRTAADSL